MRIELIYMLKNLVVGVLVSEDIAVYTPKNGGLVSAKLDEVIEKLDECTVLFDCPICKTSIVSALGENLICICGVSLKAPWIKRIK